MIDGKRFGSVNCYVHFPYQVTKGHRYLSIKFVPTWDLYKYSSNLNERISNLCKLYSWVEVNEETPIEMKLLVPNNCIFNSMLCCRDVGRYYMQQTKTEINETKSFESHTKSEEKYVYWSNIQQAKMIRCYIKN